VNARHHFETKTHHKMKTLVTVLVSFAMCGCVIGQPISKNFGKLRVYGDAVEITWFEKLMKDCSNRYQTVRKLHNEIDQMPAVYLVVGEHDNITVGGQAKDPFLRVFRYYFDPTAVRLFALPSHVGNPNVQVPPAWATDQCMVYAHELRESLSVSLGQGSGHAKGIAEENLIRTAKGLPQRYANVETIHGQHNDHLIPVGDHIERLHLKVMSKKLDRISYAKDIQ